VALRRGSNGFQTIAQLDLKTLSERKVVGAHARIEELDQEGPIDSRSRLSDELMQTRILHCPESHCVHVGAVAVAGRRAISVTRKRIACPGDGGVRMM
jgi:hypothetical protein